MPQYEYCKDLTTELFKKIMGERKARRNLLKPIGMLLKSKTGREKTNLKTAFNTQNQTLGREIQAYENKAKGQKAFLAERIIKLGDIMKFIDTMTNTLTELSNAVPFDHAKPSGEWNNLQQDLHKMVELKTLADKKKKDLEYLIEFIQPNNRIARFQRFHQAINPGNRLLMVGGNDSLEIVGRLHLGATDMREAFDKWREYKNSIKSDAKAELFPVWLENLKNWTVGEPSKGVNFFNEDEKRRTAVLFEEGGIMKEIGLSKANSIDYLDLDTRGSEWAFVIAPDEVVYCYKHMGGKQHHSAALRGGAALCAGKVVAEKGVLKKISNETGHYQCNVPFFIQGLEIFKKNGALNNQTEIVITPGVYNVAFKSFDSLTRLYDYVQKTVANGTAMSGEKDIEGIKKLFHSHGGQVSMASDKDTVTLYGMFKAKFRDEDSKKYYAERNEYAEYFGKTLYGDLQ